MKSASIATAFVSSLAASTVLFCALAVGARARTEAERAEEDAEQMASARRRVGPPAGDGRRGE